MHNVHEVYLEWGRSICCHYLLTGACPFLKFPFEALFRSAQCLGLVSRRGLFRHCLSSVDTSLEEGHRTHYTGHSAEGSQADARPSA